MTSRVAPLCGFCIHLRRSQATLSCDAYPEGIPEAILDNRSDHRGPIKGDRDIHFKQDPTRGYDPGWYDIILGGDK